LASTLVLCGAAPPPPAGNEQPAVKHDALPQRPSPNPIQTVRVFSALQERIINGSIEALQSQSGLAREVGSLLLRFPDSSWEDARNREATIRFAFMGGDPRVIEELDRKKVFGPDERKLVRGALAFAYGDRKVAAAELASIEPRSLTPGLGAQVALIKAVLIGASDPMKAIGFCDEARLLSLGTAIEEAALRLSIELAVAANSPGRFDVAAVRHLNRFPNSLYAKTIDSRIAGVLAARDLRVGGREPVIEAMASGAIPHERRRQLFELLVRYALRKGAAPMAVLAAQHLRAITPDDLVVTELAQVAQVGLALGTGNISEAKSLLSGSAAQAQSPESIGLLNEMRQVISAVEAPPERLVQGAKAESNTGISKAVGNFGRFEELTQKVEGTIGEVDKLLVKAGS